MLRIRILGASLTALIAGTAAAAAADMPYPAAPPSAPMYNPAPAFSWSGAYLGLAGGYGWGTGTSPAGNITADDFMGGVYAGYNFQAAPNWIMGIEGDYLFSGLDGNNGTFGVSNPWDATLRLRAGYAFDRFLLYGTGGLAIGDVDANDTVIKESKTKVGWTVGAGIEAAITNNVTARVEYRYTDLGTANYGTLAGTPNVGFTSNAILAGVGMKF